MTKRPTNIGNVMIHETGTNPYVYAREGSVVGLARETALRDFRDGRGPPAGFALWDDRDREPVTRPDEVDWSGLRD